MLACTATDTNDRPQAELIISGYDDKLNDIPNIVSHIDVICLEETENSLLASIQKVERVDSIYIVWDDKTGIHCFNEHGKFLNNISHRGEAYDEYLKINTFIVDSEKNILIFDDVLHKIFKFKLDGTYVSSQKLDTNSLLWMQNGAYLSEKELFQVNYIFNDFNDIYTLLFVDDGRKDLIHKTQLRTNNVAQPIGNHSISALNGQIKYILPYDNLVYSIDSTKVPKALYELATEKKLVPKKILSQVEDYSIMTSVDFMDKGYFQGFTNIIETNRHMLLTFYNSDYFLIDKQTNIGNRFETFVTKDTEFMPLMGVISSFNDCFIGVLSHYEIESLLDIDSDKDENLMSLKKTLTNYSSDSNPILVVYKLK